MFNPKTLPLYPSTSAQTDAAYFPSVAPQALEQSSLTHNTASDVGKHSHRGCVFMDTGLTFFTHRVASHVNRVALDFTGTHSYLPNPFMRYKTHT